MIAAVLYQAFIEYAPSYTPQAFQATTPTADQLQRRWREGPVWAAWRAGGIVGTVSAVPQGAGLYLRSMAVLPAARGQGIGQRLVRGVEAFAVVQGYRRLFLSTTPFLTQAIRLYEQQGFRCAASGPHDLFGTPLLTMVKDLVTPA